MSARPAHVVTLIHGIRTTAFWAEMVRDELEKACAVRVVPLRYGYFDLVRFLSPVLTRDGPRRRVERDLRTIRATYPDASLSVIAHSFGTYTICKILEDDPYFRLERLLLCGSIVPTDFRWDKLAGRVASVLNDCGTRDVWPLLASGVTVGYGPSGTNGFGAPQVRDRFHPATHSAYFDRDFVRRFWVPFICHGEVVPSPSEATRQPSPWWHGVLASSSVFIILLLAVALLIGGRVWSRVSRPIQSQSPGTAVDAQAVNDLATAARLQRDAGDYEGAWKTIEKTMRGQPGSHDVQRERLQLAMIWLRHVRPREPHTFTEVVDQVMPCLYEGVAKSSGTEAADIYAHIGWGYFLKSREGARGMDVDGQYKHAVQYDPDNPFAHAMWGHWILSRGGMLSEARQHFTAALKTGREKAYVRQLEMAALQWTSSPDRIVEIIKVGDEMRRNNETMPLEARARLMGFVYFAGRNDVLAQLPSILPPEDHLATFRWLAEGIDVDKSPYQAFFLARLTESAGNCASALSLYLSLSSQPSGLEREIEQGIARCKEKARQGKTDVHTLGATGHTATEPLA